MSDERFLITGSEGCIGSWAIKNLVEEGRGCVALDLSAEARRLRAILEPERVDEVTFVTGDITAPGFVRSLLDEHEITHVIHLAALQIPFVRADPVRGASVNVVGTIEVFEAARALAGQVRSVVYASSCAVFGPDGEDREPRTLYGVFKVCNEDSARLYWEDFGVRTIGLRPWAVFGPGRDQGLTAAPTLAMEAAVAGEPYHIPCGGRVDLQYADDVARTFVRATLAQPAEAGVYNLRGSVLSLDEIVAAIEDEWPHARGTITHGDEPIPIRAELDDAPLRALLGDVPRTDFRTAVRQTLEYFASLARS